MTSESNENIQDKEVELHEIWNIIVERKLTLLFFVIVLTIGGLIAALVMPNVYRSEALLAPVESGSNNGLSMLANQFGGLANLAGLNLSGEGSDKTSLAIAVLKSREFISKFVSKHEILVPLMAAEGWDMDADLLKIDSDVFNLAEKKWVRDVSSPYTPKPSEQEAYDEFLKRLRISQDKISSFITISFEFYSPNVSKQWVDWLVEDINLEIKEREVEEAERSIQFLTEQLKKTSLAAMQTMFYELIEEQTKTIMFAEVREEYVFKTIDPAVAPQEKYKPNKLLIVIMCSIVGLMLGLFFIFFQFLFERRNV